jgi:hypothetical protein
MECMPPTGSPHRGKDEWEKPFYWILIIVKLFYTKLHAIKGMSILFLWFSPRYHLLQSISQKKVQISPPIKSGHYRDDLWIYDDSKTDDRCDDGDG